jgi:hypothetical protein
MATNKDIDLTLYNRMQSDAQDLASMYSDRLTMQEALERIFLMNWPDSPKGDADIKTTMSPDGRNVVLGVCNLLTVSTPVFSVPREANVKTDIADAVEKACTAWWNGSNKIGRINLNKDAVKSGALFGEVYIAISSTQEMLEFAKRQKDQANIARAERIAAITPFLYEIHNPKYSYPMYDAMGLRAYYRKVKVRTGELPARFGQAGADYAAGKSLTEEIDLSIWYDTVNYGVWVEGQPFIAKPHELPVIPVSCVITDGSMMFDKSDERIQPLLYGVHKGELWERENLVLTVLYTNVYGLGLAPKIIYKADNPDKELNWKDNTIVTIGPNEDLKPMASKGIIDDSFPTALQLAERKIEESTIYKQSIGEPLTGQNAYSSISLLTQSGRLPIVGIQTQCALAYASAMEISMIWYKYLKVKWGELSPSSIPDNLQIDCKLKADLPQDKRQDMFYAVEGLKNGLLSKRLASEGLGYEQSDDMQEEIQKEKLIAAQMQADAEIEYQRIFEEARSKMGNAPNANATGGNVPPTQETGMPPESMGQTGNGLPGMPMGGVPLSGQGENPNVNQPQPG